MTSIPDVEGVSQRSVKFRTHTFGQAADRLRIKGALRNGEDAVAADDARLGKTSALPTPTSERMPRTLTVIVAQVLSGVWQEGRAELPP